MIDPDQVLVHALWGIGVPDDQVRDYLEELFGDLDATVQELGWGVRIVWGTPEHRDIFLERIAAIAGSVDLPSMEKLADEKEYPNLAELGEAYLKEWDNAAADES